MKIIANGQTYEDSTWLPGKDSIWIGGTVGETPIFGKNIPSTVMDRVCDKLKEQEETHPDYVDIDKAFDDVCKEDWEKCIK